MGPECNGKNSNQSCDGQRPSHLDRLPSPDQLCFCTHSRGWQSPESDTQLVSFHNSLRALGGIHINRQDRITSLLCDRPAQHRTEAFQCHVHAHPEHGGTRIEIEHALLRKNDVQSSANPSRTLSVNRARSRRSTPFLTDKNAVATNPMKGVKRPKVDSYGG